MCELILRYAQVGAVGLVVARGDAGDSPILLSISAMALQKLRDALMMELPELLLGAHREKLGQG